MAFIKIEDAPFSDEEKATLKEMGIIGADWGHPDVVLDDPVAHFKEQERISRLAVDPKAKGAASLHYDDGDGLLDKP